MSDDLDQIIRQRVWWLEKLFVNTGMVYFLAGNNPYNGSGYGLFSGWQQPSQWHWAWYISMLVTTPTMAVGMVYFQAGTKPYDWS